MRREDLDDRDKVPSQANVTVVLYNQLLIALNESKFICKLCSQKWGDYSYKKTFVSYCSELLSINAIDSHFSKQQGARILIVKSANSYRTTFAQLRNLRQLMDTDIDIDWWTNE